LHVSVSVCLTDRHTVTMKVLCNLRFRCAASEAAITKQSAILILQIQALQLASDEKVISNTGVR